MLAVRLALHPQSVNIQDQSDQRSRRERISKMRQLYWTTPLHSCSWRNFRFSG